MTGQHNLTNSSLGQFIRTNTKFKRHTFTTAHHITKIFSALSTQFVSTVGLTSFFPFYFYGPGLGRYYDSASTISDPPRGSLCETFEYPSEPARTVLVDQIVKETPRRCQSILHYRLFPIYCAFSSLKVPLYRASRNLIELTADLTLVGGAYHFFPVNNLREKCIDFTVRFPR